MTRELLTLYKIQRLITLSERRHDGVRTESQESLSPSSHLPQLQLRQPRHHQPGRARQEGLGEAGLDIREAGGGGEEVVGDLG